MAKNQYSLSDDAKLLGRPENFDIHIREVYVNAGAGFVVALTGAIRRPCRVFRKYLQQMELM